MSKGLAELLNSYVNKQSVLALDLEGKELTGDISPSHITDFTSLKYLILQDNQLTGEIPPELSQLSNLSKLYLHNNQLTGGIPLELSQLSNLIHLGLHDNQLTGEIPPQLSILSNLTHLSLSNNQLTGKIPPELSQLSKLTHLGLHDNQLTGEIPPQLSQLSNLTHLSLNNNQLTGGIPPELSQLSYLTILSLNNNQLTGEIPPELSQLSNLTLLSLNNNQLTGEIPPELSQLSNLTLLRLDNNQLTGEIQSKVSQLSNLTQLRFSNNQLTGRIPPQLSKLSNLTHLGLSNNQLTGGIPPELSKLSKLTHLSLYNNQLTGEIPLQLSQLSKLTHLYLNNNQLTGVVPSSLKDVKDIKIQTKYFSYPPEPASNFLTTFQYSEEEELCSKWLENCGIPNNFGGILQKVLNINDEHQESFEKDVFEKLFHQGKISLDLNDLKWTTVNEILTNLPQRMKDTPSMIQEESKTIKDIEIEITRLQKQLEKHKSTKSNLEEQLEGWDKYENEVPQLSEISEILKNIEIELSQQVITQLDDHVEKLSSLCDAGEKSTLSLVFNACGLSPDTIIKLYDMDGYNFLRCNIEVDYSYNDFSSFGEFKDVVYCQHMLREHDRYNCIPYDNHLHDCPICHYNSDNLYEILEEYNINVDIELLKRNNITGSRLLMLTRTDLTNPLFNMTQDDAKILLKSLSPLLNFHSDTIRKPQEDIIHYPYPDNQCLMKKICLSEIDRVIPDTVFRFFFVYNNVGQSFQNWILDFIEATKHLERVFPIIKGSVSKGEVIWSEDSCVTVNIIEKYGKSLSECGFVDNNESYLHSEKWPMNLANPKSFMKDRSLSIKVVHFTCGGVSVCFNFHHQVFDGTSACTILKTLCKLMKNNDIYIPEVKDNRCDIINEIKNLGDEAIYPNGAFLSMSVIEIQKAMASNKSKSYESSMQRLRLSMKEIRKLQDEFKTKLPNDIVKLSENDIITGLLWYSFILGNPNNIKPWKVLFAVDIRREFREYMKDNYIGNAGVLRMVLIDKPKENISLLDCCIAIRRSLIDMLNTKDIANTLLWLEDKLQDTSKIIIPNWIPSPFPDLIISSWARFPLYSITLNKERPIYAGGPPSKGTSGAGAITPLSNSEDLFIAMNIPNPVMKHLSTSPIVSNLK